MVDTIPASVFEERICINMQVGVAILIIFVLVCAVSLVLTAFMCYRAQNESKLVAPNQFTTTYYTPSSTPSEQMHSPSGSSSVASTYNTNRQSHELIGH